MQLQEIAERCQQGDRKAFDLLYTATRSQLRDICLRYVQNEDVANDLLHDTFLLIFNKIGDLKDTTRTEAWMNMVARRVALLYLRQRKKLVPLEEAAGIPISPPSDTLSLSEIYAAIDSLQEGYRYVFRLSVFEGMTHQEIADILHIEPHSSSSQLFRAKQMLRRWLHPLLFMLLVITIPIWWYLAGKKGRGDSEQLERVTVKQTDPSQLLVDSIPDVKPCLIGKLSVMPKQQIASVEDVITNDTAQVTEIEEKEHRDSVIMTMPSSASDWNTFTETKETKMKRRESAWSVELAYSGFSNSRDIQLPYADINTNAGVYDSLVNHHMPLTVALSVNRRISSHWQIGMGLRYMRLVSDMQSGNTYASLQQHQRVQYIGIPVTLTWNDMLTSRLHVYSSANIALNLPLRSTLESQWILNGNMTEQYLERLYPNVQWSVGLGLGLEFQLMPNVRFFIEAGLQHYFQNDNNIETWNTAHPLVPSVPLGLKVEF